MKIVIDGPIGAGKSTQVDILSKTLSISAVREPIDEWPLDLFYKDPVRWAFTMQVAVLNSFVKFRHTEGIFERSPESTRCVFWKNMVESGTAIQREDDIFQKLYKNLAWEPDITIIIDKTPELCYEHIQTRTQAGDDGITLEYLRQLDKHYQEFKKTPGVIVVDGNRSIEDVSNDVLKIVCDLQDERTPAVSFYDDKRAPM